MFLTSQAKEIGSVIFVKNWILENVQSVSVVVYQEIGNQISSKTTEGKSFLLLKKFVKHTRFYDSYAAIWQFFLGMVIGIVWNVVPTIFHGVHFASNLNVKLRNRERKEVLFMVTGEILEDLILETKEVPFVVTGEILKDLILETKDILDKLNRPCNLLNPR